MKFKPKNSNLKMDQEELQNYLKAKKLFTGSFKSKKDYNRKENKVKSW